MPIVQKIVTIGLLFDILCQHSWFSLVLGIIIISFSLHYRFLVDKSCACRDLACNK